MRGPFVARGFLRSEDAVTSVEYVLIAGAIALSIVVGVGVIGKKLAAFYTQVGDSFS